MVSVAADVNRRNALGWVAPGFEPVRNLLDSYLLADPAYSVQLAAYWRDEPVVNLVGGPDLNAESMTGLYSVSKALGGIMMARLVAAGDLDLDSRVTHLWPEFGANGKSQITVRQLLTHQAGLVGVAGGFTVDDVIHSELAADKLARECPQWKAGSHFGYHAFTIGVFMEELARRVTGSSLQALFEGEVRAPRALEVYLGLPRELDDRYMHVLPMTTSPAQAAELAANPMTIDGVDALAFNSAGNESIPVGQGELSPNQWAIRASGPAALGAVGAANGLASLFAGVQGYLGERTVPRDTLEQFATEQVWGVDRVLHQEMAFGVVFMKPTRRLDFGSYRAFGHDGAGGAIAFADPTYELSFGYVPMPIPYPGGADLKALKLSQTIRNIIRNLS